MITNSQFKAITADYEKIQNKNRHILLQRKEEIYARIPAYQELEQQISGLCIMQGRKLLSGDKQALDDMKNSSMCFPHRNSSCLRSMVIRLIIWTRCMTARTVRIQDICPITANVTA